LSRTSRRARPLSRVAVVGVAMVVDETPGDLSVGGIQHDPDTIIVPEPIHCYSYDSR
jgi:hypothetical protein